MLDLASFILFFWETENRVVLNVQGWIWINVNVGVPQGLIPALLLFLIYRTDEACGLSSNVNLFADDTSCFPWSIM